MSNYLVPLLESTYERVSKTTGINPSSPNGFKRILADSNAFRVYVKGLAEGLNESDKHAFARMAVNTRRALMENSMFQLNPYETLVVPILRKFYPKLISKELVTVLPIDKPEVVHGFIKVLFKKYQSNQSGAQWTGYDYEFPSIDEDISRGPGIYDGASGAGITVVGTADTTSTAAQDIFSGAGIDPDVTPAHIEKDFRIITIYDASNVATTLTDPIGCTVDGNFTAEVEHDSGDTDVLLGSVDFLNGGIVLKSLNGTTLKVDYKCFVSLEENSTNPKVKFEVEKIRLTAIDRRIEADWSVNFEQDLKALYDINVQSEYVNHLGEQIALDIDREIITDLISTNATKNPATHTKTFSSTPPSTFTWGPKQWQENILKPLAELSAQIYNDTHMQSANTLACNPLDAALFEMINGFEYVGDSTAGGELGFREATVAFGKWKLLVSSCVPQGTVLAKYRSDDRARASYLYCPYVPALLIPYPFGTNPSLTIMSRYATKCVRPEALGVLTVTTSSS